MPPRLLTKTIMTVISSSTRFLSLLILISPSFASAQGECFSTADDLKNAVRTVLQSLVESVDTADIESKYGWPMKMWCTSQIQDFSGLFNPINYAGVAGVKNFNEDISDWDLSSATDLSNMFHGATSFNQNIGDWDTKNVESMEGMFTGATSFNQQIGGWKTQNVQTMAFMFDGATAFDQNLNSWDTSNVTRMERMFSGAISFNGEVNSWDVSLVQSFESTFYRATKFNQPIGSWNVGNSENFVGMFHFASSFNRHIGSWTVSSSKSFTHMFNSATSFNKPIGNWDMSSATNIANMFRGASAFNQDVSGWDISRISKMSYLFEDAITFNQDLCAWRDSLSTVEDLDIFTNTSCTFKAHPDKTKRGPWCKSDCGAGGTEPAPTPTAPTPTTPVWNGDDDDATNPNNYKDEGIDMDSTNLALYLSIIGALLLLAIATLTTFCGERAGAQEGRWGMKNPRPDPNALPSPESEDNIPKIPLDDSDDSIYGGNEEEDPDLPIIV
jgi:surface protein